MIRIQQRHVWNLNQVRTLCQQTKGTQNIRKENDIHTAEYYFENGIE